MHWLADEVRALRSVAAVYEARRSDAEDVDEARKARAALHQRIRRLLQALIAKESVIACFVQHDGLVVDARGDAASAEALAAWGQSFVVPAQRAAEALRLGPMMQILLAGGERKLVLVQIGPFTLGLLAPATARLGSALAAEPRGRRSTVT